MFARPAAVLAVLLMGAVDPAMAQYRGGCGGSGLSCDQLRYYCSMGSQTPISARPYCGAVGGIRGGHHGGHHGGGHHRGYGGPTGYGHGYGHRGYHQENRPLSRRELEYYCSMGSQTPISARADCVRYGYW